MAKQPKKPAAKKSAAKKPAAKKPAAKKAAAKPSTKKPVKSKPVADKATSKPTAPAAKEPAPKKAVAKKTVAKKAAVKANPAKKRSGAKKPVTKPSLAKKAVRTTEPLRSGGPGSGPSGSDAIPSITSPSNGGTVSANTDLGLSVLTNRADLAYIVTVTKLGSPATVVATVNVPIPNTSPCQATIPGSALSAASTFTILIAVDPMSGATPPHSFDEITVTTP